MKCSCLRPVLVCFSFLVISTATLCAQQLGSVVGELHVNRGDFPGRVLVELQLHGAPIASQYTDEQGKFAFTSLANNLYYIIIRDDRFYPVDQRAILDLSITAVTMVQINLTPRQAIQNDSLQTQKGSNPYIVDTEKYRWHFSKEALKEFDKGLRSDREGKREDAIRHYERALAVAPKFYPAHNNLGADYLSRSDFRSAQSHFEEAIKLNQSDSEAHLNLANVFLQTRKYDSALSNVEEGLRRQPNSAFGKFLLGAIYERLGRGPEAEKALHEALAIDPTMSKVHLELVNLYLAEQKTNEAKAELIAFLKEFPNDPLSARAREVLDRLQKPK
jgi:tetratricopeptide (TPR) repeat protein